MIEKDKFQKLSLLDRADLKIEQLNNKFWDWFFSHESMAYLENEFIIGLERGIKVPDFIDKAFHKIRRIKRR